MFHYWLQCAVQSKAPGGARGGSWWSACHLLPPLAVKSQPGHEGCIKWMAHLQLSSAVTQDILSDACFICFVRQCQPIRLGPSSESKALQVLSYLQFAEGQLFRFYLFNSHTSVYIVSIVSVTSLYSSQYTGTFLSAVGFMLKKEQLLMNSEAFAMALGDPGQCFKLQIHHALFSFLFFYLDTKQKHSRTSLHLYTLIPEKNQLSV